jgi:hypothetical protein
MMPQCGASLTDDSRVVINNHNMFKKHATEPTLILLLLIIGAQGTFLITFGLSVELVGNERKTLVGNCTQGWFAVGEALVSMLYNFFSSLMKRPNKLEHLALLASLSSLVYYLQVRSEPAKYYTRLESLVKEKHSSISQTFC